MFSCLLLIVCCCLLWISSPIILRLCSELLAHALFICNELKGLIVSLLLVDHELALQTLFFVYRQSICWARDLLGIRRHGKHNENNAFVTIVCPWSNSATVVHWLQTINLMRAGLAIGEHGKEHNRTEIMASQLLFSHQLTLQMLPSFHDRQSIWAMKMSSRLICYALFCW